MTCDDRGIRSNDPPSSVCRRCYHQERFPPSAPRSNVIPNNRMHQANRVAVHHAAQMARQHSTYIAIQAARRRRAALLSRPLPAPPEQGRRVEHDVTSLGLKVTETYTIKEAHLSEGVYQFELLDAKGNVIWSGAGDNREDAYLSMAVRLSEREDPGDLPDYT